ncbi:hypothetical protein LTR22_025803 [Elasticomyces elasticus]|nr:hypothetical protein LTR22_025803 [Elasticomyces elasticus]
MRPREGQTGKIELKATGESDDDATCDDPEAIKLMIDFFYHLDYNADPLELTPMLDTPEPLETLLSPKEPVLDIDGHDPMVKLCFDKEEQTLY